MLAKEMEKTDFITLLGLENIPEESQHQMLDMAVQVVESRALNRVLDELKSDDDTDRFVSALEAKDADALQAFFSDKKIDFPAILREESLKLKQEKFAEFGSKQSESVSS